MGELVTMTAMVLSASNVGDFDRRLVLLTRERGRITAFVKGARRPNSQVMGACQPFSFGQFALYEGRTAYNLHHAEISNYFAALKADLEGVYLAMYFCEFANYLTRENSDESAILKLLYQSLRALEKTALPKGLVRNIYEIKILAYYGQAMQVFGCVRCGREEKLVSFESHSGGVLCDTCTSLVKGRIWIDESTLYTLQYILSSSVEKLYTFTVSPKVMEALTAIAKQYVETYVDVRFKTLEFLTP